jgi:hypothetical protein
MVYNEWFGVLTAGQLAAYQRFNVSPSDHDALVEEFGENEHSTITEMVKVRSGRGYYNAFGPVTIISEHGIGIGLLHNNTLSEAS